MGTKIVNDPIHGFIELHPLAVKIIDTPQFQRLRNIKQLGATYYVYPGAGHNRFEHSIGTYHIAGVLMRELQKRLIETKVSEKEAKIDDCDILCVQIAALCHDLGHGPFSHMFDGMFIPKVEVNNAWKHEIASLKMFDHLIDNNNLLTTFEEYGIKGKRLQYIKDYIHREEGNPKEEGKEFLYEVVSNDRSGIDVDKFDYFARDCYHLGMHSNFDHNRFLKTARLVKYQYPGEDNEVWTIAFRKKDEDEVYQLFHTRRTLHERAYQHPVSKAVEVMITDALMRVNNDVKIQDKDGKDLKMSEAINDMVAYTKLTDEVVYRIINSDPKPDDSKEYCEARDILKRIMERSLYPVIWEKKFENNGPKDGKKIEEKLREVGKKIEKKLRENITSHLKDKQGMTDKFHQLVELYRFPLDYGKNEGNPAKSVTFYDKKEPTKGISCDSASHSAIYPVAKTCFYAYFRQQSKKRTEEESKQIEIFQEALDKAGEEI